MGLSGAATVQGSMRGPHFTSPLPFSSNLSVAAVVATFHSSWREARIPIAPVPGQEYAVPALQFSFLSAALYSNPSSTLDRILEDSDHKIFLLPQTFYLAEGTVVTHLEGTYQ